MPLNEYRYLKKTDKGQQISLSTGKPKKKKQDRFTPYYHYAKISGKKHFVRLRGSELKHHEIVYTKEGRPIANPMAAPGLVSLLPMSSLDLAFETMLTGASYAKGVDPRVAILAGIAAGKIAPKVPVAAKIIDEKSGAYLTERAIKKGFESVKKDPMFKDIPFEGVSDFLSKKKMGSAAGHYRPDLGYDLMGGTSTKGVFGFRKYKLSELLASPWPIGQTFPTMPKIFNPRNWPETIVRHEGRHYKQNVEGVLRHLNPNVKSLQSGYPADWGAAKYSTLIEIPKPKNPWPGFEKRLISKKTGNPMKPDEFFDYMSEKVGKSKARKHLKGYIKKYEKEVLTQWDPVFNREYYRRPIEVEARLEEIVSLGNKRRAYSDLIEEAGYSKKQVDDMAIEYRKAKRKKYPPDLVTNK